MMPDQMGTYRKQIQIVGDILDAAEELTIDQEGASITKLIQKANIWDPGESPQGSTMMEALGRLRQAKQVT